MRLQKQSGWTSGRPVITDFLTHLNSAVDGVQIITSVAQAGYLGFRDFLFLGVLSFREELPFTSRLRYFGRKFKFCLAPLMCLRLYSEIIVKTLNPNSAHIICPRLDSLPQKLKYGIVALVRCHANDFNWCVPAARDVTSTSTPDAFSSQETCACCFIDTSK
ncbi:hypothetical protein V1521DRAFT_442709 [Lipomyces starkeyi]